MPEKEEKKTERRHALFLPTDTLESFTKRYGITVEQLAAYNEDLAENNLLTEDYLHKDTIVPDLFIDPKPIEELNAAILTVSPTRKNNTPLYTPRPRVVAASKPVEVADPVLKGLNNRVWGEEPVSIQPVAKGENKFGGVYAVALKRIGGQINKLEEGGAVQQDSPEIFQYIKGYAPKYSAFNQKAVIQNEEESPEQQELTNDQFNQLNVEDKASYIKKTLQDNGLEDWEATGFVAVMYNESGLKPEAENQMEKKKWTGDESYKYGRGLCQWSLGRNDAFRDFYHAKYGKMIWANEASVNDQLEFALQERSQRTALLNRIDEIKEQLNSGKISKQQAAVLASDAYRRGFENGSSRALASSKQMDAYTKVGSPDAAGFSRRDTSAVKKFFNV